MIDDWCFYERMSKGAAFADSHLHEARLIRMRKWAARAETLHPALSASVAAADDVTSPTRRLAPAAKSTERIFCPGRANQCTRWRSPPPPRVKEQKQKCMNIHTHTPGLLASRNKASGNAPHKKPPQTPGRGRMTPNICLASIKGKFPPPLLSERYSHSRRRITQPASIFTLFYSYQHTQIKTFSYGLYAQ